MDNTKVTAGAKVLRLENVLRFVPGTAKKAVCWRSQSKGLRD